MATKEQEKQIAILIEKLKNGNQRDIARLMSLVEDDIELSSIIIKKLYKDTGNAYIIGVTGAPGSGKSSIINSLM